MKTGDWFFNVFERFYLGVKVFFLEHFSVTLYSETSNQIAF